MTPVVALKFLWGDRDAILQVARSGFVTTRRGFLPRSADTRSDATALDMHPTRPPDAKVMFRLTSKTFDGQVKTVRSGYRPVYDIRPDYWTSTHHEFLDRAEVATDEETAAHVWFITPDAYQHSLWIGRVLTVAEGSRKVGTATVLEVLNPILQGEKR